MKHKKTIIQLMLFASLVIVFLPVDIYHYYDMQLWKEWAIYIHTYSIGEVYDSGSNYPPVFLHLLNLFGYIQGSEEKIAANFVYLKLFSFAFDLLPVVLIILLNKRFILKKNYHLLLLFNFAYFFNSLVWGQVDAMHSNLSLASLLVAFQFPVVSAILYVIALNTKMQAIIFLPLLLLILTFKVSGIRQLLILIASVAVTEVIITLPFIINGNFSTYLSIFSNSIGFHPSIGINAFNFWQFFFNENPNNVSDNEILFIFSYKYYGLFLFMLFSSIVLLPVTLKTLLTLKLRKLPLRYIELIFLTGGMTALVFFYFNTQMHERYSHPAMIFFFFYGAYSGRFIIYILTSAAYFLNVENVMGFFKMHVPSILYERHFISCLFLLALIMGIYKLYSAYNLKKDYLTLKPLIFNNK